MENPKWSDAEKRSPEGISEDADVQAVRFVTGWTRGQLAILFITLSLAGLITLEIAELIRRELENAPEENDKIQNGIHEQEKERSTKPCRALTKEEAENKDKEKEKEITQKLLRGTILIKTEREGQKGILSGRCSGFILDRHTVITAQHCLLKRDERKIGALEKKDKKGKIKKVWSSESEYPVIIYDYMNDVCLIRFQNPVFSEKDALEISIRPPKYGEKLTTCGHPRTGLFSVATGFFMEECFFSARTYITEAAMSQIGYKMAFEDTVNRGNSGGPVVNEDGEVIGLESASDLEQDPDSEGNKRGNYATIITPEIIHELQSRAMEELEKKQKEPPKIDQKHENKKDYRNTKKPQKTKIQKNSKKPQKRNFKVRKR